MARPDYCPVGNEPCQSMCDEPCSWSGSKRRNEDDALIRQMLEALEGVHNSWDERLYLAITAARARLGEKEGERDG
jgi:hypothetical protein